MRVIMHSNVNEIAAQKKEVENLAGSHDKLKQTSES